MNPEHTRQKRIAEGAAHYAAGEPSDPFLRARIAAHIRQGIVGMRERGEEAFYSASPHQELRKLPNGGDEYFATVYKDRKRP